MSNKEETISLSQMRKLLGYRSQSSFINALKSKMPKKERDNLTLDQARWSRKETYREIPVVSEANTINQALEKMIKETKSNNFIASIPLGRDDLGRLVVLKTGDTYL